MQTWVSVDEESRWKVTGMVSEKLLLDLSLRSFSWQYEENRISVCDWAGT